ncbi:MAG: NAD(P)-dependent alcohol dehydrogenase [Pseudomonadota bacterium]
MTKAWILKPGQGADSLELKDIDHRPLGDGDVRVAIKAASLNSRDLMIAGGHSPLPVAEELTPLSDGAGEIVELGSRVSNFEIGDRVVSAFNPAHLDGPYTPDMEPSALGGVAQGVLAETVVLPASALVKLPADLSFEQAACLPCAGVVAWNGLFESGAFMPGQTVFATGTGTVSLIALCLAKAAGARFGLSSGDPDKLERASALGADFGVNYRAEPDWDQAVKHATGGHGADIILENAGPPSIAAAVRAAAQGGRVAQIGFKAPEGPPINVLDMMLASVSVKPVMVGSRAMLERLVQMVAINKIELPVEATFSFAQAREAFDAALAGDSFGKIIISNP